MQKKIVVNKKINNLLVLKEFKKDNKIYCKCLCTCGRETIVKKDNLLNGHTKSCGCLQKNPDYDNLIGKKFGMLEVIDEIITKDKNGHHHYLCKCDCGNVIEVLGVNLLYDQTKSCGCFREVRALSKKIPKSNTSGVKGVYFDKRYQKWVAKITFQGVTHKSYFKEKEKAILQRKTYEEQYHNPIIKKYEMMINE